ncbi:MAG: hypothetical protein Q9191_003376 [Dirinaria sp. TL-2023a]
MKRSTSAREGLVSPPPTKRRVDPNITGKAIASFFTPASKKQPSQLIWRVINSSLLLGSYDPRSGNNPPERRKIAAFDLVRSDFILFSSSLFTLVPSTLKKVYEDGFAIAILTNQGRLSLKNDTKTVKTDQKSLATFKTKVDAILSHFDYPIILLAATARDQYRKPRLGMWNELLDELDLEVGDGPDLSASFFVGDAAGRPARDSAKADHSCSDRDFAENVGIRFQTPEEYFLHKAPEPYIRHFVPTEYIKPSLSDAPNASKPAIRNPRYELALKPSQSQAISPKRTTLI